MHMLYPVYREGAGAGAISNYVFLCLWVTSPWAKGHRWCVGAFFLVCSESATTFAQFFMINKPYV